MEKVVKWLIADYVKELREGLVEWDYDHIANHTKRTVKI